jgi:hypothetical protein
MNTYVIRERHSISATYVILVGCMKVVLICLLYAQNKNRMHKITVFFFTFPSSGILETRKHDDSETGSVSVLR